MTEPTPGPSPLNATPRTTSHASGLSIELREDAARRLAWTGLPVAILFASYHGLQQLAHPASALGFDDPITRILTLIIVLAGAGLFALYHYRVVHSSVLLNLGMAFEIAVAFVVSMVETSSRSWDHPFRGVSAVGPWVVFLGAFVPNTPRVTLITALTTATTWPAAHLINQSRFGYHDGLFGPAAIWLVMNYLLAIVAWLASRWTYGTLHEAKTAEDLGSYRLVAPLGEGGMGEVWKATHRMLARSAAIKLIRPEVISGVPLRQSDAFIKRFRREADAIATLQSPHTVYLYDFGMAEDGRLYYAMELLDGISLHTLVERFGPQPASRVVAILSQACQSLDEAHAHGLVHRDLKPSNVMICRVARIHDFVKVLDFGLAKSVSGSGETQLTIAGTATGTPGYMAPEVVMGEDAIDRRADLYALGCIAYLLLTGTPVFDEVNPTNLALKHVRTAPDPPSSRTELSIPAALEQIVLRCLAKRPTDRPASAAHLQAVLEALDVPAWSAAAATEWWETHLPATSSLRKTAEPAVAAPRAVRKV
jgi:eukaryotic-like serine/threonine-protein kinase